MRLTIFLDDWWRSLLFQGHLEPEGRSLLPLAFKADLPGHQFDQLFRNRQAQSRSSITAGGRTVRLGEGLENARLGFGWNPNAGVSHRHFHGNRGSGLDRLRYAHSSEGHTSELQS